MDDNLRGKKIFTFIIVIKRTFWNSKNIIVLDLNREHLLTVKAVHKVNETFHDHKCQTRPYGLIEQPCRARRTPHH